MTTTIASRAPGAIRRQQILDAAARLFLEEGYHGVSVDSIGAAAGITGPAIYRHFPSKEAILIALFEEVTDEQLKVSRAIREEDRAAIERLAALVDFHTEFALRQRTLISVYSHEERHLPAEDRSRIRARMRMYLVEWMKVLKELHPSSSEQQRRAAVHAAVGLINAVANFGSGLRDGELATLLRRMAMAALVAGATPEL